MPALPLVKEPGIFLNSLWFSACLHAGRKLKLLLLWPAAPSGVPPRPLILLDKKVYHRHPTKGFPHPMQFSTWT